MRNKRKKFIDIRNKNRKKNRKGYRQMKQFLDKAGMSGVSTDDFENIGEILMPKD